MAVVVGNITLDGLLGDWTATDRIDGAAPVDGFEAYGKTTGDSYVFAIKAPLDTTIGTNTTMWLNTDQNNSTGYKIWGWANGVEYQVELNAGALKLYAVAPDASGNPVTTYKQDLSFALGADGTTIEFAVPKAAIGSPAGLSALIDINDQTFLPGVYNTAYAVTDTGSLPARADLTKKVAIVYSDTTAARYFGLTDVNLAETAYTQLFMAAQNQAAMAGVPFDVITEADLKDLSKLVNYDAIVFPSFEYVKAADVAAIESNLTLLAKNYDTSLITAGNFMTNSETGAALADAYARMKALFDVQLKASGWSGSSGVTIKSVGSGFDGVGGYTAGETINAYSNSGGVGWLAFEDATAGTTPLSVIATQTVTGTGGGSYNAVIASSINGDRNVLFSTTSVMGDNNQLSQAISYAVNGATGPTVGLQMSRQGSIVASRTDMDQSQYIDEVHPDDGSAGIYDKMLPILQSWKTAYNFVGSYYINIGDKQSAGEWTNPAYSLPYYQQLLALGNEIGSHSYTHLVNLNPAENTNILKTGTGPGTFDYEFRASRDYIANLLGLDKFSIGAAVPGAGETRATAEQIIQYYDYLTGGYSSYGAGYPGAFGYLSAQDASAGKVYLAPNMKFDFTLIGWEKIGAAAALAEWKKEFDALSKHAELPVILWPWHDYGVTVSEGGGYTKQMYTDFIAYAYSKGAEFVTLADLADRIKNFEQSSINYSVSGSTVTATVTSADAGKFALDLDNLGSQVIKSVAGWYAYDSDSVFTPKLSGGAATYTITLGAAADDVTHITALPMRAELLSVSGDGTNLSFSLIGEGQIVIDLGNSAGRTVSVSGARIVSQVDDMLTLDVGANGQHDVTVTQSAPGVNVAPTITSAAAVAFAENGTGTVLAVTATDAATQTLTYAISGDDAALFTINAATGALQFKAAPDFETPQDQDQSNVYGVTVTVSDNGTPVLSATQALSITVTDVAGITYTGTSRANTFNGGSENDTINGNGGNDTLYGNAGDDAIKGGAGNDKMYGGFGNDTYIVNSTGDLVSEVGGGGTDTVKSSVTLSLSDTSRVQGDVENLALTGSNAINGTGNALANVITGNSASNVLTGLDGADTLSGAGGRDRLIGGAGNDTLTGGRGVDAFVFRAPAEGVDTITDFVSRTDYFEISASGFGGGLVAGTSATLKTVADVAAASNTGTKGYFIFDNSGANAGTVYWDPTGGVGSDAVAFAKIAAGSALVPTDFHVV
ncbi:cadherin domain-containing protein [Blastochloris sulfoviridis]|uniref:cadherin domain-containing protein n=1 Tax=Blastochloris sulfoviridis TaxID=50712 RepID=UPI0014783011|nr:cadherin domain-containing protein [Blastochloris sulfoviridis]